MTNYEGFSMTTYITCAFLFLNILFMTTCASAQETTTTTTRTNQTETTPATDEPTEVKSTTIEEKRVEEKDEGAGLGGFFVEPLITYEKSDVEVNFPSPFSKSDEEVDGFGVGVKLGFHALQILSFGIDGRYSILDYDSDVLSDSGDADSYDGAVFVGLQTPFFGIRVWGSYIFTGEMDPDSIGGVNLKFKDKTGYRLGAGLFVKSLSVNIEYQNAEFDETSLQNAGPLTGDIGSTTAESEGYILSVSFPIPM